MKDLGSYILLFVICAPSFYVISEMVKDDIRVFKHAIQRKRTDD
jgi:hypothetical protein